MIASARDSLSRSIAFSTINSSALAWSRPYADCPLPADAFMAGHVNVDEFRGLRYELFTSFNGWPLSPVDRRY